MKRTCSLIKAHENDEYPTFYEELLNICYRLEKYVGVVLQIALNIRRHLCQPL